MAWWLPDRRAEAQDPEHARLEAQREAEVEERVDVEAHEGGPIPEERGLTTHWQEEVSPPVFEAALRALADALSQGQNFTFAVDHHFMVMRPIGRPSIEYYERANQRKEIILRYSWEA